ncbi:hypothetical protein NFI96_032983 [Prochilodus magdalenae]|nr:hypothetical protein NFI96_032983 [Prochilodus magdalenae]
MFTQPFSFVSQSSGSASLRCSMSSSADFSDDDDSSLKSGSVSPAPGDTLPWNLPRHERSKRKIQGGSVLDPAERAVLRIAVTLPLLCCSVQVLSTKRGGQQDPEAFDLLPVHVGSAAAAVSATCHRVDTATTGSEKRSPVCAYWAACPQGTQERSREVPEFQCCLLTQLCRSLCWTAQLVWVKSCGNPWLRPSWPERLADSTQSSLFDVPKDAGKHTQSGAVRTCRSLEAGIKQSHDLVPAAFPTGSLYESWSGGYVLYRCRNTAESEEQSDGGSSCLKALSQAGVPPSAARLYGAPMWSVRRDAQAELRMLKLVKSDGELRAHLVMLMCCMVTWTLSTTNRRVWRSSDMEGSPARAQKPRFSWTVQEEEKLVELWREHECVFDVSSHFCHDRVEKEKGWTEIAEALKIPGANASPSQGPETLGYERDRVQKKTFTKWINQHLLKVRKHVNDLYEDLRDGHNLISLLEVLSGDKLPREKGRMRFHRLQNVQIALDYLKRRQVKLVNIRNDDITDGNPKLTLGLIWTIILHFQVLWGSVLWAAVLEGSVLWASSQCGSVLWGTCAAASLATDEDYHLLTVLSALLWRSSKVGVSNRVDKDAFDFREFSEEQHERVKVMGNVCGCVRGHKEECYVDPTKAPLSPASKELRGRRYFQRRKKRKSGEFLPGESVRSRGGESCHSETLAADQNEAGALNSGQEEASRPRQGSVSHGVYVGEIPVLRSGRRLGLRQPERDRGRPTMEQSLHGVTKSSRCIAPKDGLLEKKLLRRQLRRAVSFGAVEHMLRTLRGCGSRRGSAENQMDNMKGLSRIICDSQVHRKRRRASTCSGAPVSHGSLDSVQDQSSSLQRHEISDIHVTGESEDMTAKERLLLWSQQMTEGYVGVRCDNFTTSWRDGRLFNALIHKYRRGRHATLPLHVGGSAVEVVSNYRYLGVHLSNNLTWSNTTSSLVRKAHQRLYFLRRLRRAGLGSSVLTSFYRCVVESVLCSSINVWHGSCSAADRKALQRVVKAAQRPDLVDMSKVSAQSSRSNLEQAFGVAEQLGVARLLDPEDVDVSSPDEKSVITYVSTLYDVFPKVPEGVEGISANDVDIKWVEYQNMVNYLSQWIKHNVSVMSDRNFPSNPVELKALYSQYLHFKESEIPVKENEKTRIKHLYKMLEVWIEFGRIHLPQGYHPNDVEKEWGKLIVAMLEREKSLRPEVDRYETPAVRFISFISPSLELIDSTEAERLEHPHTVPADGAVGVEVEGHQAFWTCDDKPFISVLTTVPPHTDSLGVSTKTKAGLSNLVYRGSVSSVSNSTLTSLGSAENLLSGGPEPFSSTPLYLNNNSVYGPRLEMLQQIANRVQRDCVAGEDKLALARTSLQSDAKRLESGIQFQNEAEVAGYLLECENLLRQQVVDIQILLDGKFYLADQLVQRVSKLRDDLLSLRTECSSVYSKGRTLTSEQTKIMISGITQSLNSGFSQSLNAGLSPSLTPALTPGALVTPVSTLSSGLSPALTPAMTPAMTPGMQPALVGGGHMETGVLQHLKQMQIRKPMLKSSLVDPNLSEEEVNMKFVQDLLNWVEEMQVQLDRGEWGSDLPSVESHLDTHRNVHKAIEDFQMSLKEAKISEIQMTPPLKQSYSEKLGNLENQYARLLSCSRERQKHLDSLHDFVSQATQELIWLNEKEEEEVAFDWSERNSNISRKKDYHAELMRELDQKEGIIKSVQDQADGLLQQNHPARLTIEAYKAAMQTQWSWILQLCYCVEQHLKESTVYFEFFSDAKESMDYLKSLQDSISRKYSCDRTSGLHRLEDLIQESMDEKEQLLQYRSTVAGLVGRAKSIIQLKPRNPESPVRTSIPVKAICDYRQIEITIYKDDECVLANNSHRAKWKVISPSGNEAMVPAVCFSVPPPNKEAIDMASRIEQLYQNVLALWHRSHINMKSVVSWHYLMMDIRTIRKSTVASIKTMLPGEHQQVLSSLQSHFEEFLEDSEESEVFTVADCAQLEREVLASKEYYEELLKSAERGKTTQATGFLFLSWQMCFVFDCVALLWSTEEHEESVYNLFISEVRNFRMRVEAHEEQLIRQVRTPLDRDDLQASMQRINEQERKKAELDRLKEDLEVLKEKCEVFLRQAANSPSVPTLSSELNVLTQSMAQVYSMCSIYLEKLKSSEALKVKHSQSAEALVKLYEATSCLTCLEFNVLLPYICLTSFFNSFHFQQWRSEIDDRREVFHDLEDELQKARVISDRMFKTHNERDFDLDWHKEKAEQLGERWRNVHSQIENRSVGRVIQLRDLEGISKSLKYYKDTYSSLDEWSREMEANQLKTQENQPEDSKALAELVNQQKVLVAEIERKQSKIEECQKYSEHYSAGVKDYELQLMTYRAMVESQHKSPVKRRRMQSSSDAIQQEFMDLRTRYTALVTLMTQYVKFASETLKRAEEDERRASMERTEYRSWMESMEVKKSAREEEISRLQRQVLELEASLSDRQQQLDILGGELEMQKKSVEELSVQKSKAEYEAQKYRLELEAAIKGRTAIEQELNHSRQLIQQSEAKQVSLEESLRMLKKNIEESTVARRKLEEHLRRKNSDVQDLEEHRRTLERELKAKEDAEVGLLNQVRTMEMDLTQQSEARALQGESRVTLTKDGMQKSTFSSSVQLLHSEAEAEALQYKLDELMMGKKRAETEIKTLKSELNSALMHKNMAEEKAQRFKELLDDANNRLMKLQVEMESDRNSNRQKSEDLRQEASELRKSVYIFQEQVKSLQRDKSSLEQRVLFHKTEVDGLKEQLKINQGKLLQRSTSEQESCQRLRCLEEELSSKQAEAEQMKFKVTELTRMNQLLEGDIRHLTVSIESFQQEKSLSEQKIKALKNETENLKDQLQKARDETSIKARAEKDMQLKIKNLELELQKSDLQVTQLTKKVEELRRVYMETERSLKNLNAELDKVSMDAGSKDQQISIFKSQADSTKSQLKIIEEELMKKTQTAHELQIKLRDFNDEAKKTSELQQKVKTLMTNVSNYEKEIRSLKAELTSMSLEKNLANQKVQEHKVEMNNLNLALQKESTEGKKNVAKLRELENELLRCRQTMSRMSGTSEKATVNLKQDISTLQRDKQAADQKLQTLKSEFDELNSTLKKTKDELLRVTQDWKLSQSKLKDVEAELQKNRMAIKEISSSSDKYTTNLQQECSNLLKQKGAAEEKVSTLGAETSQLKMKLEQTQEDLVQKQKETAAAKLRSQMLEDQLENCKRMLEDLKGKLELQKKGYETQLQLVQNEMEQKLALQESRLKLDYDRKEKQKGVLDLELLQAKSRIAELEMEKIQVKSSISQMDSVRMESSRETTRMKQMLTEAEQKFTLAENEAKLLKEQVASYIKEVKSLQEKNLKLEVTVSSLNKQLKESETVTQGSHRCAKDGELAKLKTELILTQKIVSSYEEAKQNLEEELKKMKETSEIATLEKDKVLDELKRVKQDKTVTVTRRAQEEALGMTEKSKQPRQTVSTTTRTIVSEQTSTSRKSSLSEKSDRKSGKSQSVSFNVRSSEFSNDAALDSSALDKLESCSSKLQGLRGRISIKKLIKTRIITQELALKLQTGLVTLEEVQASLAQFSGKPASIAGIYLESSKKKISFMEAAEAGLLAKTYAIEFLEAQAATGAIIDPITGDSYAALDALEKGVIGRDLRDKITEADKAVSGYPHGGKILSVFQAMEERIVDRHRGKGILEAQIATGGLIHPLIGMRVPLDCAIEQGLINQATLQTLFDPVSNPKSFHNPETGQRAYYSELLKMCVYDVSGGVYLLPIGDQHSSSFSPASTHRVSVINSATGIEMSTYEAYKARLIDMRTYLFLSQQESEWQETTVMDSGGNNLHILTDHKSGRQFCIEHALSLKILHTAELDSYRKGQMTIWELADLLISRNVVAKVKDSPIAGLWVVALKKRLSILKGLQQNLVDRLTALKLLEAQACTGGICDPASGERVQIVEALRRGLLDESFTRQLQQFEQAYHGVIHPQSGRTLTVAQAMHENLFPKDVGLRCLEYQLATGGLIDPESQSRVSVEEAIRNCLIDKSTAAQLKDDHSLTKNITCPKTKRKISYKEALEKGVCDSHTGLLLLDATKPHITGASSSFQYIWTYRHF